MKKISLTGIKPTGTPHLGNYLGAIRPALELSKTYDTVYFIADYHALTTVQNGAEMRANIYKIAATWLALGLNPEEGLFYKQSDIPEIFELSWALSCFTPKGCSMNPTRSRCLPSRRESPSSLPLRARRYTT